MKFTTQKGYGFFEATSALQKSIRRGNEEIALYFAVEFFNSGYDEYLWRRINIIASEDVGLAEPNLPANLNALYQSYSREKEQKKDNRPERMFLIHAVLLLVRAQKSRLVDWNVIKVWREHGREKRELPEWVFDMHNAKGKAMGRGIDHFYENGTQLANWSVQPGEIEVKKDAYKLHIAQPGKLSFAGVKKGTLTQQNLNFEEE